MQLNYVYRLPALTCRVLAVGGPEGGILADKFWKAIVSHEREWTENKETVSPLGYPWAHMFVFLPVSSCKKGRSAHRPVAFILFEFVCH